MDNFTINEAGDTPEQIAAIANAEKLAPKGTSFNNINAPATNPTNPTDVTKSGASSSSAIRSLLTASGQPPQPGQSFDEYAASIAPNLTPPTPPNYVDQYQKLRAQNGVPAMEDRVTALESEKAQAQGALLQFKANEQSGGETEAFYTGRLSEAQRNVQAKLDSINLEEGVVQQALATKNSFISTIMDLTQKDYAATADAYNKAFTRNIQLQNSFNTKQYHDMTLAERASSDARAKIATMNSILQESGQDISQVLTDNPDLAQNIAVTEMTAGLPVGFMATFAASKPKADIIATSVEADSSGREFVAVVSKDPSTGTPTVSHYYTGGYKRPAGTKLTVSEQKQQATDYMDSLVTPGSYKLKTGEPVIDPHGFVNPKAVPFLISEGAKHGQPRKQVIDSISGQLYPGDKKDFSAYSQSNIAGGLTDAEIKKLGGTPTAVTP